MNRLSKDRRKAVITGLIEGASINAIVRTTGVSKPTILKLVRDLGCACAAYHDEHVRKLQPKRVQCDEIWSFVHCKQKRVSTAKAVPKGAGDCWTWTAIDSDTKLMISYLVGLRTPGDSGAFMLDLAGRITNLTQLTSNGLATYPDAVYNAFGTHVDFAQLIKVYRADRPDHARYSPAESVGGKKKHVIGCSDPEHISTSIVEWSNLNVRMQMRRFTRLTNGHSKKIENHGHAVAMFFQFYNYCRPHQTLGRKTTPAMAAGLADHVWTLEELIGLLD